MMQEPAHSEWQGNTDGTPFMQRALVTMFKVIPLEVMYAIMALVVPFYMLFNHKGYLAIYHFFRRRMGCSPVASFLHVYRNHFAFGQVVLDRFAAFAGCRFKLTVEGNEHYLYLADQPGGFMMLSSHVGTYEQAGYVLRSEKKQFYALIFEGESEVVKKGRVNKFADKQIHMIPVRNDMSHIFEINRCLDEGNIVSMPADRHHGSGKSVTCRFFDADAKFPLGPFATAVQKEVPVLSVIVMKEGVRRFRTFVVPLQVDTTLPRRQQMQQLAQEYASNLEATVRRYPHQWYNYYEFWND